MGFRVSCAAAAGMLIAVAVDAVPVPASAAPIPSGSPATISIRFRPTALARAAANGTLLLGGPLDGEATIPGRYGHAGAACLTAGDANTPASSIPACGAAAAHDNPGFGALQLSPPAIKSGGFTLVAQPAFSTAAGLVVTFTDYSFGGTTPSADGMTAFFSDASRPAPTAAGQLGGSLGYADGTAGPGIAAAYLGVGFDEYGNFSSPTEGRRGGPGQIPETIAVRGAASTGYAYLTGAKNGAGAAASLPFHLDAPAAATRPANAPTVRITLTPAGVLAVAIDRHDGNGFLDDIPPTPIVGLNGQPAVPANVYLGFTATTGGYTSRHQINGLTVSTIGAAAAAPDSSQDNVTYHNNNLRTGWYQHETTLTAANVASTAFRLLGTAGIAGKSYAQPLYLSAQRLADGSTHNVVIVADATDVVYAFDADTLAPLWRRDFKGGGIRQQRTADIGCDDTWPDMGINGTPVVDRARNRMYVVVPTNDKGVPHLRLHALALGNGADAVAPVEVAGSVPLVTGGYATTDPSINFDRAALLETGGTIYVPLSTHCDFGANTAHGWLLAYRADTLAPAGSMLDTTRANVGGGAGSTFLGSIWQGGFGIAADAQSNVYFATGNGPNDGGKADLSMSVVKLPPTLDVAQRDFFTPSTWLAESRGDVDLGSGGVMLLPDQNRGPFAHLAVAGGKTGMKFVLNRDDLGGLNAVDHVLYEANMGGGIYGGPAYFVTSAGAQTILYGGTPQLCAYALNPAAGYALVPTSFTNVGSLETRNAGVTPIVSSNGTQAGTAVVWALQTPSNASGSGPIRLFAFDGANLGHALYAANAGVWKLNGDTGGAMITPMVANGRVYLATDGVVSVFGLH